MHLCIFDTACAVFLQCMNSFVFKYDNCCLALPCLALPCMFMYMSSISELPYFCNYFIFVLRKCYSSIRFWNKILNWQNKFSLTCFRLLNIDFNNSFNEVSCSMCDRWFCIPSALSTCAARPLQSHIALIKKVCLGSWLFEHLYLAIKWACKFGSFLSVTFAFSYFHYELNVA
jgi:hypothetical protein